MRAHNEWPQTFCYIPPLRSPAPSDDTNTLPSSLQHTGLWGTLIRNTAVVQVTCGVDNGRGELETSLFLLLVTFLPHLEISTGFKVPFVKNLDSRQRKGSQLGWCSKSRLRGHSCQEMEVPVSHEVSFDFCSSKDQVWLYPEINVSITDPSVWLLIVWGDTALQAYPFLAPAPIPQSAHFREAIQ